MKRFPLAESGLWRWTRELGRKFAEDNCVLVAAAISFFTLLSVIPLMLLAVAVLGSVLSGAEAQQVVLDYVQEQLPGLEDQIANQLRLVIKAQQWSGVVGFVGLVWASGGVFLTMEVALNLAWHAHHQRSLLQRRALALIMTLLAGVPLILSLLLTGAITTLRRATVPILGLRLGAIPALWTVLAEAIPLVLTVGSFTAIYRWVPNCPVRWRAAVIGGVTGGVLWELAKRLFAVYAANLGALGGIYGPFAGIIGLMVWVYYSALILLVGAEVGAVAQSVHAIRPDPETTEAAERLREVDSTGV